jgi:hypothetical protein
VSIRTDRSTSGPSNSNLRALLPIRHTVPYLAEITRRSVRWQPGVVLVLAGTWFASLAPADTAATGQTRSSEPGPNEAVITINGFCAGDARAAGADTTAAGVDARAAGVCKTIITRAQFDRLAAALQPDISPSLRLKVAAAYARMMKMAALAQKRGLDKTVQFKEAMHYARLQLLSQDLGRELKQEADQVTDAEIAEYYSKNPSSYEQATLARIFIPRAKHSATAEPVGGDAMTAVAANLRSRAAHGEDPDGLQLEAYAAAGVPASAPSTLMAKTRRSMLPPSHEMAMDLQPGEVSEVIFDPGGGYFIYKMVSKGSLTPDEAKLDIHDQISRRRYRDLIKGFEGGVVYNEAYFSSPMPPSRHREGRRADPPAEDAKDQ